MLNLRFWREEIPLRARRWWQHHWPWARIHMIEQERAYWYSQAMDYLMPSEKDTALPALAIQHRTGVRIGSPPLEWLQWCDTHDRKAMFGAQERACRQSCKTRHFVSVPDFESLHQAYAFADDKVTFTIRQEGTLYWFEVPHA